MKLETMQSQHTSSYISEEQFWVCFVVVERAIKFL